MTEKELNDAIVQKWYAETQSEEAAFLAYLRRNGEDLQSIQRHIPKVPPPWQGPGSWRG